LGSGIATTVDEGAGELIAHGVTYGLDHAVPVDGVNPASLTGAELSAALNDALADVPTIQKFASNFPTPYPTFSE
jgi:hypothetical protein